MLRPLTFVAVRQQQHEPAVALPFCLARGEELIDDDLCAVSKVAELRFPEDELVRRVKRIPVFEAQYRGLGEEAIVDHEPRLLRPKGVERVIGLARAGVVQHCMALTESAAPAVLPAEPNRRSFQKKRAERQRLAR